MKKKHLVPLIVMVCTLVLVFGVCAQAATLYMEVGETKVVKSAEPKASYLVRETISKTTCGLYPVAQALFQSPTTITTLVQLLQKKQERQKLVAKPA